MFDKRGDLTSTQIIMIVLAIAGFVIILIFFTVIFQNDGTSLRLACEQSVLTRATVPDALQAGIPLNCKTEKLCVTTGLFGNCEQFTGEDDRGKRRVHVSGNFNQLGDRLQARGKIEETMATAMRDCWNMVGRGEWDIYGNAWSELGFKEGEASCIICARIAFDEELVNTGIVNETNLNIYLQSHEVGDTGKNYIEFFTNGETNAFPAIEDISKIDSGETGIVIRKDKVLSGNSEGNQFAIVFSQNKVESIGDVSTKWAFLLAGGVVSTKSIRGMIPGVLNKAILLVAGGMAVSAGINTYSNQKAAAAYCGDMTGVNTNADGADLTKGCSVIQVVEYNPNDINKVCDSIQSLP